MDLGKELLLWVVEVGSEDVGKGFCGGVRLMIQDVHLLGEGVFQNRYEFFPKLRFWTSLYEINCITSDMILTSR